MTMRTCPAFDAATHKPVDQWLEKTAADGTAFLEQVVVPKDAADIAADRAAACVRLSAGVTVWLDSVAAERQYDGIHALVGYVTSANAAWKAEAQAGIAWRDGVWSALPAIQAEIMDGTRPVPTLEALKAELPQIAWPP